MVGFRYLAAVLAGAAATLFGSHAFAQNTGGVFPPMVNEGHKSAQYRIGYNPDTDNWAQRVHYQQALDGDFMWRVVGQIRRDNDGEADFDYVQGELFWDLNEDSASWRRGLRLDVRLRDDNRPGFVGVNWMNQFKLTDNVRARALVLTAADFGDNARDGIFIGTRADIARRLDNGVTVGVEMFNNYGTTDGFADFDDQQHTAGPFAVVPMGDGYGIFVGTLFGLTDAATENDLRFWVTKRF